MTKLIIKKLFNIYDFEIDLSKKCIVFIGENGLGKSTVLKIIYYLINEDYVSLTKYQFESINIEHNNEFLTFKYTDLFPSIEFFKKEYSVRNAALKFSGLDSNFKDEDGTDIHSWFSDNGDVREPSFAEYCFSDDNGTYFYTSYLGIVLEDVVNNFGYNEYCYFLSSIFFDLNMSERVQNYLKYSIMNAQPSSVSQLEWIFKNKVKIKELLKSIIFKKVYLTSNFFDSNYELNFNTGLSCYNEASWVISGECFLFNMVDNIQIESELYKPKQPQNRELNLFFNINHEHEDVSFYYRIHGIWLDKRLEYLEPYFDFSTIGFVKKEKKDQLIEIYKSNQVDFSNSAEIKTVESNIGSGNICINKEIAQRYYDYEYIKEINSIASRYFIDIIGDECIEVDEAQRVELLDFYIQNNKIINDFVKPIIIKYSIFDKQYDFITNENSKFDQSDLAFKEFYTDNIDSIMRYRSAKADKYESLLQKFLFNKDIKVTNKGLVISNKDGRDFDTRLLSSGENRIVILMFITTFLDNISILIDEPELSLSIIWQSWLLKALLNNVENRKVIIATHSPYIVEDDSLQEYVHPLYTTIDRDNNYEDK